MRYLKGKVRYERKFYWLLLLGLLLLGCTTNLPPDDPPDIRYGEDVCDQCQMIINDPRFAASYVTASGEEFRFDDIGDMLTHYQQEEKEVHRFWVHDFNTLTWVDAESAVFVVSSDVTTPMGWGLVAFEEMSAAETFAAADGGVVTNFEQIILTLEDGTLAPTAFRHAHVHETSHMGSDH